MPRPVFATDLDATLIWASKRMPEGYTEPVVDAHPDGRPICVAGPGTMVALEELCTLAEVIYVTARNRHKLERIQGLPVAQWAIVGAGAAVLHHGVDDPRYAARLRQALTACASVRDAEAVIAAAAVGRDELRVIEGSWVQVFYSADQDITDVVQAIADALAPLNWLVVAHGRKVYCTPAPLTKAFALDYVCEQVGAPLTYAAGDSYLDLGMLTDAPHAYVPADAEIVRAGRVPEHALVTIASGPAAGQEIVERVVDMIRLQG